MKIVLYALIGFLLIGCGDDASTQNKVVEKKTQVKEQVEENVESAKKAITETAQEVKETAQEVTKEVKEKAKEVTKELKETAKEAIEEVKQKVAVTKDGSTLYKTCAACHGADASKAALGKSQIIKGWSAQKIADALNGYKSGTYGGAMKGLMSGQVKNLSPEDIEVLSQHISKF
ncbi:MAG: hypothetical protein M0Q24_05945 [Sulfurimonas sp.]|uniref:c-type cytochrome n=1 Tax=Sulfurimonas sp. TaxID=2022749 RepID=UPI0025D90A0B|nr:c-type cytochrome [Sulfurimonas sp.]MCK9491612.1 hypothetical protein [Sulfurimonas sp.]